MIPIKLSVKNFMCYRDDVSPLHFGSIHVACLCGDNGHGKTALLDAITWALWGIARATPTGAGAINALRIADLVHMGQTDMGVELDFTAGDQRYRVIRRHTVSTRGSSSRTTLELQIATDDEGEAFRSISRNTVRETNARISEILNMDFKTFVNTAYLAQGQADLFTTSTPAERKRCLADVLDLAYYQRLSESANARSRNIQTDIQRTLTTINLHSAEAARKSEYQKHLDEVDVLISEDAPKAEAQRKQVETLRREAQRLQTLAAEFTALRQRAESAESDVVRLQRRIDTDEKRLAAYQAVIDDAPNILKGFGFLQSAQTELARLDAALSEKSRLDAQYAAFTQAIARREERISSACTALRHRISTELQPRANRLPQIRERQRSMTQRHSALKQQSSDIERQRVEVDAIFGRIQTLEQDNNHLRAHMTDTRQKFDMLTRDEAACPLCNQQLDADGQQRLRAEYRRAGMESRKTYDDNHAQLNALAGRRKIAAEKVAAMEARREADNRKLASDEANLARDEQESLQAQNDLLEARKELDGAERLLRDRTFAQNERAELTELKSVIAALEYDAGAHEQVRAQVAELRHFETKRHSLNEAQTNMPGVSEATQNARDMLRERQEDIGIIGARKSEIEQDIEALPSLKTALAQAIESSERLEGELRQAEVKRGVLKENIARCEELEGAIRTLEQERTRLARDKSIYDELTIAFGKNGIQALIIESAIPQLQDDANEILGRVTENRMHLSLELDESTSEQLEIRIADELGTRDYLTFSGGEAFRINFALRIALSRLLARRSGAPLPVLFIDEGFGSQDRLGQERLTEAIQSIQDDFEKIIVITHIDRIKEAFPVRIEVSKGDRGSTFAVV